MINLRDEDTWVSPSEVLDPRVLLVVSTLLLVESRPILILGLRSRLCCSVTVPMRLGPAMGSQDRDCQCQLLTVTGPLGRGTLLQVVNSPQARVCSVHTQAGVLET
jgi:hypothetical protein